MPVMDMTEWEIGPAPSPLGDLLDSIDIPDPYYRPGPLPSLAGIQFTREPVPAWIRAAVFERDGWACRWCGSSRRLQIDHILPVSAGGGSQSVNLRTLCARCNGRRGHAYSDRYSARVLPVTPWCIGCTDEPSAALRRCRRAFCVTCGTAGLTEKIGQFVASAADERFPLLNKRRGA